LIIIFLVIIIFIPCDMSDVRFVEAVMLFSLCLLLARSILTALDAIKKLGGSVTLLHYNKIGMKYLLHPEKFQLPPYLPPAPAKINNKLKKPMSQPNNDLYVKVRAERRERARVRQEEKAKKLLEKENLAGEAILKQVNAE
jgi:hypothetical protein